KVIDVSKRFSFPLRQRHALSYTKKSVVLVGDAAHTIHPLAGQGINLGLKDVKVLSEEIIKAVDAKIAINDAVVLKRYERRRKGDNLAMMAAMEGFKRLYGSKGLMAKLLRNRGMDRVNSLMPLKKKIVKQAMGL
ncbi:MAG: FAD-dependent monooxygenase, partial [Sinobacterium sp.]|nr:FAD-dependent monooxygenase [Sinobacterium sp.]